MSTNRDYWVNLANDETNKCLRQNEHIRAALISAINYIKAVGEPEVFCNKHYRYEDMLSIMMDLLPGAAADNEGDVSEVFRDKFNVAPDEEAI